MYNPQAIVFQIVQIKKCLTLVAIATEIKNNIYQFEIPL
jgi:hypothetical protein